MSSSPQPADFGILLGLAYQRFVEQLHASLSEQGFTDIKRSDGYVFRRLGEHPMTVSALAAGLEITKQGAAQIIEDMERRGYLWRRPDPRDRRAQLVELSERGSAALAAARRFHREYERRLNREHGAGTVAGVRALLTAVAGDVGGAPAPSLRSMYL